jgi:hypothetical protein
MLSFLHCEKVGFQKKLFTKSNPLVWLLTFRRQKPKPKSKPNTSLLSLLPNSVHSCLLKEKVAGTFSTVEEGGHQRESQLPF